MRKKAFCDATGNLSGAKKIHYPFHCNFSCVMTNDL